MDNTPLRVNNHGEFSQLDTISRSQVFRDEFFLICGSVRVALQVRPIDIQLLEDQKPPIRRLRASIEQYGQGMDVVLREYLLNGLNEVLQIIQAKIQQAEQDRGPRHGDPMMLPLVTTVRTGVPGRPKKQINQGYLRQSLSTRRPADIAPLINVSTKTIRRRAVEAGIQQPEAPVVIYSLNDEGETVRSYPGYSRTRSIGISEDEIDTLTRQAHTRFPNLGQPMLIGYFRSLGHNITRSCIRDSLKRLNIPPPKPRRGLIQRDRPQVAGPNALWHQDRYRELIRWKLSMHCYIDEFSRTITGIHVVNKNWARTVSNLFHGAIQDWGRPTRLQGGYWRDNENVTRSQEGSHSRELYFYPDFERDTVVQKLWRDMSAGFVRKWADFFRTLEADHGLNIELESHIWLLHYLFLDQIGRDAKDWVNAWNRHPMRLPLRGERSGKSPLDTFLDGMIQHGARGLESIVREYQGGSSTTNPNALNTGLTQGPQQPNNELFRVGPPGVGVVVESSTPSLLTQEQLRVMNESLDEGVEQNEFSMEFHRERWVICLEHLSPLG